MTNTEDIKDLVEFMGTLSKDVAIPRNVREAISNARDEVLNEKDALDVRLGTAIYLVDDVSNDINLPPHARSELWNLVSKLEELKGELG